MRWLSCRRELKLKLKPKVELNTKLKQVERLKYWKKQHAALVLDCERPGRRSRRARRILWLVAVPYDDPQKGRTGESIVKTQILSDQ